MNFVSPSRLRNFLLNDSLVDFLKLNKTDKKHLNFTSFIMEQGNIFEKQVVDKLKNSESEYVDFGKQLFSEQLHEQTLHVIQKRIPIIFQGHLKGIYNNIPIIGIPDIIIRSDILSKLIDYKYDNIHYVIIDIKFNSIPFASNRINILNSQSYPYYKGQLFMYNYMLSNIQNYNPNIAYIYGRGDKIGEVNFKTYDNHIENRVKNGLLWIQNLNSISFSFDSLPLPFQELYPNMCIQNDNNKAIKEKIAFKIGELTLLWGVGLKERNIAHSKGVFSFYDRRLNSDVLNIKNPKKKKIINNMLYAIHNQIAIYPSFLKIDFPTSICFIDFETISDVVYMDKNEEFIFMIGIGIIENDNFSYTCLITDSLSKEEENKIINRAYDILKNYTCAHWSNAEPRLWKKKCNKLSETNLSLQFFDLLEFFKDNGIVIKDCYNYSLKSIIKALSKLNLVENNYEIQGGLDAMVKAYNEYKNNTKNFDSIIEYNKSDCKSLFDIMNVLKNKYKKKRKLIKMSDDEDCEIKDDKVEDDKVEDDKVEDDKIEEGEIIDNSIIEAEDIPRYDTRILKRYLKSNLPTIKKRKIDKIVDNMQIELYDDLCTEIPQYNRWKVGLNKEYANKLEKEYNNYRDQIEDEKPSIKKILEANISDIDKKKAIQLYDIYACEDNFSPHKIEYASQINILLNNNHDEHTNIDSYQEKINKLQTTDTIKKIIKSKYNELVHLPCDSSNTSELKKWLNWVINLPYNKKIDTLICDTKEQLTNYANHILNFLNSQLYKMTNVKEQFIEIIINRIKNPKAKSGIIALKGSAGVGKSTIAKIIAQAMNLPFERISLGGCTDSTIFKGCVSSWSGSAPSIILQSIKNMNCCNGVLVLDELDKIAGNGNTSSRAKELQSSLLQVLDYTQNNEFRDDFICEFPHDISNLFFICTMNDDRFLDPPLKDRLTIIEVPDYSKEEQKYIIRNYIFVKAMKERNLNERDCILTSSGIDYMLEIDDIGTGLRKFKKIICLLLNKINLLKHSDVDVSYKKDISFPIKIDEKLIISFLNIKKSDKFDWRSLYV